jgi:hypothetical protein
MIYYLDELVNWKNPKTDIEKGVKSAIEEIREKYFGDNKPNVVKLLNIRAEPIVNGSGYYEPTKQFPIRFINKTGEWRYTKVMPKVDKNGTTFISYYELMSYMKYLYETDIEYIYYLLTHCESIISGRITVVDDEAIATATVASMSSDLELRYQLYAPSSPIANDKSLLGDIAITFGIKDVDSIGINQLKNRIYDVVTNGDSQNHRFINTKSFMELIGNEEKRRVAKVIHNSVKTGDLVYSNKDYGWHFVEGGRVNPEIILSVAGRDSSSAIQYLINECASNEKIRKDIYGYLGLKSGISADQFRSLNILTLREKCKKDEVQISNIVNKSKEELVEALCAHHGAIYEKPVPA